MHEMGHADFLIQTKLLRPPLPVDLVARPHLTEWLNRRRRRPLTLVSAPAGYGKSTLISCWLESVDCPSAWFSLDEHDNDLGGFLTYFLAAICSVFPGAVPETQALLMSASLPPVPVIANTLIHELNQIERPFILVLDDYHLIDLPSIHDLLNLLLLHPPHNLNLVLSTRLDPPLPLVKLRARNQMTDVRVTGLRFDQQETALLLEKMIGVPVDQDDVIAIDSQAEGWVTGLRLAALALRHRVGRGSFQGELSLHNRYMTEYLVTEILANQTAFMADCLLKSSVLERFCAGLCEAVIFQEAQPSNNGSADSDFNGDQFLEWLQASNLFVIALDDRYIWFRYHHLFREFLQQELNRRLEPHEISELHSAAGRWYAQKGWIEEAFYHLLQAGDHQAAVQLFAQHRYALLNNTEWPRLERWLNLFPPGVVENSPELCISRIWLIHHRGQLAELPPLVQNLATLLEENSNRDVALRFVGEMYTLRCVLAYHAGDAQQAVALARQALESLSAGLWIARVLARMFLAGGLVMTGDASGGYRAIYGAFEEEPVQNRRFKATVLMGACYFHWLIGDLPGLALAAKQCIVLCNEINYRQILGFGNYHLGSVYYEQNDLSSAATLFGSAVSEPYNNYGNSYANSACGLALTYQAEGREAEARKVVETAIDFLLRTGNTTLLPLILALQAEVALLQGRLSIASEWAKKLEPVPPLKPMSWFLSPHITLVKVWLAQNTHASQAKAANLLRQLQEYLEKIHNTRFLIETLALQALQLDAAGDQPAALIVLERALRLSQPGGFIRLFVDLGDPMQVLLSQLQVGRELSAYIDQIRSAFPDSKQSADLLGNAGLLEPLTNREMQVLELLRDRLTNKEIADRLVISPGTVKGYTIHIYQKLGVKGRRRAVAKAIALGVLAPE